MKIKRSSWHYQLARLTGMQPPDTLCGYVWTLLAAIGFTLCLAAGAVFVAVCTASIVLHWFIPELTGAAWIGGSGSVFMLAIWLFWEIDARRHREFLHRRMSGEPAPQASLVTEWLRAKKQKVCPTLEYEQ